MQNPHRLILKTVNTMKSKREQSRVVIKGFAE